MPHNNHLNLDLEVLEWIAMARGGDGFEALWYLDKEAGQVLNDMDPEMAGEAFEEFIEAGLVEDERFVMIPARETQVAWQWMEVYIGLLETDEATKERLYDAIQGRGAFSRFHDKIAGLGLWDDWHIYKNRAEVRDALNWLLDAELINEADIDKGMQLVDNRNEMRQQIEEDQANMVAGATVECWDNLGHGNKITIDRKYRVLAERSKDLLIRIKDDRGKVVWIPKSHFCLVPWH